MAKIKIDPESLRFYNIGDTGIPGTFQMVAIYKYFPAPVGTIYFRLTYDRKIEILDSYVNENYRRNRIRSKMNDMLFALYPEIKEIVTQTGTKTGKAFMKSSLYNQKNGYWEKTRE